MEYKKKKNIFLGEIIIYMDKYLLFGVILVLFFSGCNQAPEESTQNPVKTRCLQAADEIKTQQCFKNVACIENNPEIMNVIIEKAAENLSVAILNPNLLASPATADEVAGVSIATSAVTIATKKEEK